VTWFSAPSSRPNCCTALIEVPTPPEPGRGEKFLAGFVSVPFDDASAEIAAEVRSVLATAGSRIGPYDLLIASIARAHSLTLVTHNTSEFQRVPGLLIDDWEA
jgi:tRNA(fMet)-specific endonuclease VapC